MESLFTCVHGYVLGVGFRVRGSSGIDWLILQLHYGDLPDNRHQFAGNISLGVMTMCLINPK